MGRHLHQPKNERIAQLTPICQEGFVAGTRKLGRQGGCLRRQQLPRLPGQLPPQKYLCIYAATPELVSEELLTALVAKYKVDKSPKEEEE